MMRFKEFTFTHFLMLCCMKLLTFSHLFIESFLTVDRVVQIRTKKRKLNQMSHCQTVFSAAVQYLPIDVVYGIHCDSPVGRLTSQ